MKKSVSVDSSAQIKKQRIDSSSSLGLLRFGFTGITSKEPSAPVPSKEHPLEFTQCPLCSNLFTTLEIVKHVDACYGMDNSNLSNLDQHTTQTVDLGRMNAFDVMKKSAAIKPASAKIAVKSMYFALISKANKLLPVFSTSADYIDMLYAECSADHTQPQWTCTANVRKFRMNFSKDTNHQPVVLCMSTNVPPDQGVSFADTAPISTAVLKSMLQKAVRRRSSLKAVKLANMMCKSTPMSNLSSADSGSMKSKSNSESHISPVNSPAKPRAHSQQSHIAKQTTSRILTAPTSTTKSNNSNNNNSLLSELLRRLPIICLEDAALHPSYPILIWLMVAISKNYTPCNYLLQIVLLITYDIAQCIYKDCTPPVDFDLSPRQPSPPTTGTPTSTLSGSIPVSDAKQKDTAAEDRSENSTFHTWESIENDSIRTLLASICIRAGFGGMTGDMEMLDIYAQMWYMRLLCDDNFVTACTESASDDLAPHHSAFASSYVHSSYTNAFFCGGANQVGWAQQMYDNFTVPLHRTNNDHIGSSSDYSHSSNSSGGKDHEYDSGSIAENVEVALLAVIQRTNITHSTQTTNTTGSIQTYTHTTNHASTLYMRAAQPLSSLLRVTSVDLVSEGIDHHCDWSLIPYVLSACVEKTSLLQQQQQTNMTDTIVYTLSLLKDEHLEDNIKSAVWAFRSSSNSRKLLPYIVNNTHNALNRMVHLSYLELVDTDLSEKRKLSRLWGVVCPIIVAYCDRKIASVSHRL